jgi:hypothetical protein
MSAISPPASGVFSFWIGSGFVISAIIIPSVTYIVATIYAVSAIAGLLTAYEDK